MSDKIKQIWYLPCACCARFAFAAIFVKSRDSHVSKQKQKHMVPTHVFVYKTEQQSHIYT